MPLVGFEPTISTRRAAADLRLRPRGHWDNNTYVTKKIDSLLICVIIPDTQATDCNTFSINATQRLQKCDNEEVE